MVSGSGYACRVTLSPALPPPPPPQQQYHPSIGNMRAKDAVLELLACTSVADGDTDDEGGDDGIHDVDNGGAELRRRQTQLCSELIRILERSRKGAGDVVSAGDGGGDDGEESEGDDKNGDETSGGPRRVSEIEATPHGRGGGEARLGVAVREAVGDLPSSTISRLPGALSVLVAHRIEASALLPATQDERANLEVLSGNAMTISRLAASAGRLYATLVGMTGAWGSGLIDVGALSGLAALVRRWSLECRGREPTPPGAEGKGRRSGGGRARRMTKRSRVNGQKKKRMAPLNKKKRVEGTRRSQRSSVKETKGKESDDDESDFGDSSDSDDEAYERGNLVVFSNEVVEYSSDHDDDTNNDDGIDCDKQSETSLIKGGLLLALSFSRALVLTEFHNWASEAKEALIDSVTTALTCAAALSANANGVEDEISSLCLSVVGTLTSALQACVRNEQATNVVPEMGNKETRPTTNEDRENSTRGEDIDESTWPDKGTKKSQITMLILRGLFPYLSYQAETPNGHNGRLMAHKAAAASIEGILSIVSDEAVKSNNSHVRDHHRRNGPAGSLKACPSNIKSPHSKKTPGRRRSLSRTPGRRLSVEAGIASVPTLKRSATPRVVRSRGRSPLAASRGKHETPPNNSCPRPSLSVFVGLLQRMATLSDLNKAEARNRASSFIKTCLPILPKLERSHFLHFIVNLSRSKRASHRLFAVDLIGHMLPQDWLWSDHSNGRGNVTFIDMSNIHSEDIEVCHPSSSSCIPSKGSRDLECCIPALLLAALSGRLGDRAPAVRARSAQNVASLVCSLADRDLSSEWEQTSFLHHDPAMQSLSKLTTSSKSSRCLRAAISDMALALTRSLRKRASSDSKATVKVAAISALTSLLLLTASNENDDEFLSPLSRRDIDILSKLCGDPSVATRKAASGALTKILEESIVGGESSMATELLESAWVDSVLPLMLDQETTCAAKVTDMAASLLFAPVAESGRLRQSRNNNDNHVLEMRCMSSWRLLARISETQEGGGGKSVKEALVHSVKCVFQSKENSSNMIARPLTRELRRVTLLSLHLNDDSCTQQEVFDDSPASFLFDPSIDAQRRGAWCLLDALATCSSSSHRDPVAASGGNGSARSTFDLGKLLKTASIETTFVSSSWDQLRQLQSSKETPVQFKASINASCRACLRVMADLGACFAAGEARRTADNIKHLLLQHELSPDLIGSAIDALGSLTCRSSDSSTEIIREECAEWIRVLYVSCERTLESYISSKNSSSMSSDHNVTNTSLQLERAVFTVGETAMVGFSNDEDGTSSSLSGRSTKDSSSYHQNDPLRGLHVKPSKKLVELIQALLPYQLPTVNNSISETRATPVVARAHAYITLGKICLRDEALAKSCVNLLARELHHDQDDVPRNATVQSNALLVFGDLCVKYTNLADRHLPAMAACLQANASGSTSTVRGRSSIVFSNSVLDCGFELVRKHAILLLTTLLLQDYIKWRGLLIHRFLAATVDECDEVSKLSEVSLCGPLLSKQPNLFLNNFVESIFVFNGCSAHPIYASAANNGDNGAGIAVGFEGIQLSGPEGRSKRLWIYRMMLQRMGDEEKISVTARLSKVVLGGAVQSTGDLSAACKQPVELSGQQQNSPSPLQHRIESATSVISDALAILTSPWCRVGRASTSAEQDDEDNAEAQATLNGPEAAQLAVVRGRLLSKLSRKHLIESVLPILCSLKSILEDSRSPLLKDLMQYLVHIFRSYKNEVKELLAGNPTLLQEIEYDTKQFEKKKRQEASIAKKARVVSSPKDESNVDEIDFSPSKHPIAALTKEVQ